MSNYKLFQIRLNIEDDRQLISWLKQNRIHPAQAKELLKIIQILSEESGTVDVARLMAYIKNYQIDSQSQAKKCAAVAVELQEHEVNTDILQESNIDNDVEKSTINTEDWLKQMSNM